MKRTTLTTIFFGFTLVVYSLLSSVTIVGAQDQIQSSPTQGQQQTQTAPQQLLSADQLDDLVAPIALYPDPLLSQILVASTYPLEVVEANQWMQRHKDLSGQALVDAARQQPWDPSIQALVVVPDALAKLNEDVRWTTDLGNAFLSQEADTMNAVQHMRVQAEAKGRLYSTRQQKVTSEEQNGNQVIVIQPADADVIYVPVYDPSYIWGPPAFGYYPPLYYPTFGFGFGIGCDFGSFFADWGGWGYWGWGPSWYNQTVFVNSYFFNHYGYRHHWGSDHDGRAVWIHNPVHRMNVPYRTAQVAARFGGRAIGPHDSYWRTSGARNTALPYTNRSDGRVAGRNLEQGYRASPQAKRYQNMPGQTQQYARQSGSSLRQSGATPQVQRSQNQVSPRYQVPQQYRSESPRFPEGQQVSPFGNQRQLVVPFGNQRQQVYRAPQQNRSFQQIFKAPRIQQFESRPQQSFRAPQQFRSVPQMSAPRFSGGGFGRSSGGINRGGGGFNRGGGNRRR